MINVLIVQFNVCFLCDRWIVMNVILRLMAPESDEFVRDGIMFSVEVAMKKIFIVLFLCVNGYL